MIRQLYIMYGYKLNQEKFKKLAASIVLILCFFAIIYFGITTYNKYEFYFTGNLFSVNEISNYHNKTKAPEDGTIGIWKGKGLTNDNKSDYYIVHDYSFYGKRLLQASEGNTFKIKGQKYRIYKIKDVSNTTIWNDIKDFTMYENKETATFQVCIPNTNNYRLFIAEAQ